MDIQTKRAIESLQSQMYCLKKELEKIQDCCDAQICTSPFITVQPDGTTIINQDNSVTLYVTAQGSSPLSYQWKKDGNNISGATHPSFNLPSAQPTDSASYTVEVSNECGTVTSDPAVLEVNDTAIKITAYWGWYSSDPYSALNVNDALVYQGSGQFNQGANIVADYRLAPEQQYFVLKVPVSEPIKDTWFNTDVNNGAIPDQVWYDQFIKGSYRYYVTRVAVDFDTTALTTFSS